MTPSNIIMTTPPDASTQLIQSTVEELRSPSSVEEAQKAAIRIHKAIRGENGKAAMELYVDSGLLEAIVIALKHDDQTSLFYLALLMTMRQCLLLHKSYTEAILTMGGHECVVGIMDSRAADEDICTLGVDVLRVFMSDSPQDTSKEICRSVVQSIVKAMETHKESVLVFSLGCRGLIMAAVLLERRLGDEHFIQRCENCITYGNSRHVLEENAQEAVSILLVLFAALSDIRSATELLRSPSCSAEEADKALNVLIRLLDAGWCTSLIDAGVFDTAITVLKANGQPPEVYHRVCQMLSTFMMDDERGRDNTEAILDAEGLAGVTCFMNRYPSDEVVQVAGMALLGVFYLRRRAAFTGIIVESSLKTMESHQDSELLFLQGTVLLHDALCLQGFSHAVDKNTSARCIDCISYGLTNLWNINEIAIESSRLVLDGLLGVEAATEMTADLSLSRQVSQLEEVRNPSRNPAKARIAAKALLPAIRDDVSKTLVDAGLFESIINAMKETGQPPAFYGDLCGILLACMSPERDYTEQILDLGGLESLLDLMHSFADDTDIQESALSLLQRFASAKHKEISTSIIESTVTSMDTHKDSAELYLKGCVTLESALEAVEWNVEDRELFQRAIDCVWGGVTKHPYDEEAQLFGRRLLHSLAGKEAASEMIAYSEYRHCADAECSGAA